MSRTRHKNKIPISHLERGLAPTAAKYLNRFPDDLYHERGAFAAMPAEVQLQRPAAGGYIALFDIAVETGVVMVVYLHDRLSGGDLSQFLAQPVRAKLSLGACAVPQQREPV